MEDLWVILVWLILVKLFVKLEMMIFLSNLWGVFFMLVGLSNVMFEDMGKIKSFVGEKVLGLFDLVENVWGVEFEVVILLFLILFMSFIKLKVEVDLDFGVVWGGDLVLVLVVFLLGFLKVFLKLMVDFVVGNLLLEIFVLFVCSVVIIYMFLRLLLFGEEVVISLRVVFEGDYGVIWGNDFVLFLLVLFLEEIIGNFVVNELIFIILIELLIGLLLLF